MLLIFSKSNSEPSWASYWCLSMVLFSIAPSETENDEPKPWIPGEACLSKKKNVEKKNPMVNI